jgi:putative ABC transport system ATP-binding protein
MDLLRVQRLKKSFPTTNTKSSNVVDVENFTLQNGEFCGLKGISGSGKTTFLHLIAGILSPDTGTIELQGDEVTSLSNSERDRLRANKIGYIFQSFNLLQGFTALENLTVAMSFAASFNHEYAIDLLDRVGLSNYLHYYPRQLSIGQQQRVALARALVNRPELVLADEPTVNLDSINAGKSFELLCNLCNEEKSSLLVVSHDEEILRSLNKTIEWGTVNCTEYSPYEVI